MSLFWYKRKVVTKGKGVNEEGKEVEKDITTVYWDCLNTECIVRGLWRDKNIFSVLMNDGHEQAEDRQKPIFKNGKPTGYEVKRERDWFYSQIDLDIEDAQRLWIGKMHPSSQEVEKPKGQLISEGKEAVIVD